MLTCQGKKVLITGATSGIGKACAERFAKEGAHLILCGRNQQRLHSLEQHLSKTCYTKILPLIFDITDPKAVEETISNLPVDWRDIDILINNAGMALGYDKLYQGNVHAWDQVIDTNLKGVIYMTRYVAAGMVQRQRGHIINIGSISSRQTYSGGSVYCATKFAVRGLTDTLRMDLHGSSIKVTLIDPGMVKTDFFDVRLQGDQAKVDALFQGLNPLQPEDVADVIVYCASLPAHVCIQELTLMPTDQTTGTMVYRRKDNE
ncbi:MAG: SDR family NAD(P)-dependent oxidoreductase [Proteobacteria bacterium]|nr:SDR family NAD(P)-dependent oxidoreductase [Pseudomonadota bacterium]